jgi:energy-coupling factor transporter ATP-binding protein EcfA2
VISGGQRKRLNIALELIREPSVLFLDEPTSGLSSRDSENVIDLLRELTFKGKLIFTVIHQPSSEIFKMFDKMLILDHGGEMVYYGNPIEALIYFKTLDTQIDSNIGECPSCGNINPETIFNIIETEVVDEFGKYTGVRKVSPGDWAEKYYQNKSIEKPEEVYDTPSTNLNRPSRLNQFLIFAQRDLLSKIANRQYVMLTLLEAPVLGFILSYIVRYIADPSSNKYIYLENENIPIYIFMGLIVALFVGLISSAEEIFKDRKVLRREHFLNLSNSSYLLAKILILFFISAIQTFLFVIIANNILGINGLTLQYWLAFFTTAAFANVLGLNISASFNSAITIYIVVPMLMIPMMVLSGAMFPFDKLNRTIGSVGKVPIIAEIMPTKWTYEALIVTQAKDNKFDKIFYEIDKEKSVADFNTVFRLPAIETALNQTFQAYREKELSKDNPSKLKLIQNEFSKIAATGIIEDYADLNKLNPDDFNHLVAESAFEYINRLKAFYNSQYNSAEIRKDKVIMMNRGEEMDNLYDQYHNLRLEDIVKKVGERIQVLEYKDNLIQNYDPIYQDPSQESLIGIRSHFLSPSKRLFNREYDTFIFNIAVVWIMTLVLYSMLYFNVLPFFLNIFNRK